MIGEQFAHEHEICGAVISVRKVFFRLALWIRSSDRNETTETLGYVMDILESGCLLIIGLLLS